MSENMTLIRCEVVQCADCGNALMLRDRVYIHPENWCKFSGVRFRARTIQVEPSNFLPDPERD